MGSVVGGGAGLRGRIFGEKHARGRVVSGEVVRVGIGCIAVGVWMDSWAAGVEGGLGCGFQERPCVDHLGEGLKDGHVKSGNHAGIVAVGCIRIGALGGGRVMDGGDVGDERSGEEGG